jgi:hypothetical protein
MANAIEMPKYKCHKEVWALKISKIEDTLDFPADSYDASQLKQVAAKGLTLHFENSRYSPREVSLQYALKHSPRVGGYYVQYKDGYESFSPASEFEEGYNLIGG